ncbi:MAG: hypothetical protein RL748_4248 [Pseudomonadota bacterium]
MRRGAFDVERVAVIQGQDTDQVPSNQAVKYGFQFREGNWWDVAQIIDSISREVRRYYKLCFMNGQLCVNSALEKCEVSLGNCHDLVFR